MGTPAPAAVALEGLIAAGHEIAAVYTQPDRPSGRGNRIKASAVKETAIRHGLVVLQPEKIKTPEALAGFKSFYADVAVVVAYGRILPAGFLNAFPKGAINVHFSLLPKYRGAAPVNWAIVNGETQTGVTTIQMDEGLDTGDVLLSTATDIGKEETAPELMDRLAGVGAETLLKTLSGLGEIVPVVQDHVSATFAPIMKRYDGRINWSRSAEDIANRIRGFQPFPGSFSFLDGKRVVFWAAQDAEAISEENVPGEIVGVDRESFIVAAGNGTFLRVIEIQFEGGKRSPAANLLNGGQISLGKRFE